MNQPIKVDIYMHELLQSNTNDYDYVYKRLIEAGVPLRSRKFSYPPIECLLLEGCIERYHEQPSGKLVYLWKPQSTSSLDT